MLLQNVISIEAEKGSFKLEPAYEYEGIKGQTPEGDMNFKAVNQQALQMDDFVECIRNDQPTRVPAEMGLRDMEIIAAVYKAAETNRRVELSLQEFVMLEEY